MFAQNPVFIPGPTNMPEVLRRAADMPTLDHRSPLFAQILHPALAGVKTVLKSQDAEVFVFPSTATGGWETALSNTLSAGDAVLAARHGMFSHRWIDMTRRHGLDVRAEALQGALHHHIAGGEEVNDRGQHHQDGQALVPLQAEQGQLEVVGEHGVLTGEIGPRGGCPRG